MLNSSINKSLRTIELHRKSTNQCETKSFHGCDKYTNNFRKTIAFYSFFRPCRLFVSHHRYLVVNALIGVAVVVIRIFNVYYFNSLKVFFCIAKL